MLGNMYLTPDKLVKIRRYPYGEKSYFFLSLLVTFLTQNNKTVDILLGV